MRLEQHRQAPLRPGRTNSGKRSRNFIGMMTVVVDVHDTPIGDLQIFTDLATPADPGELGQRLGNRFTRHTELPGNADRRRRIQHVVAAGQIKLEVESLGAIRQQNAESGFSTARDNVGNAHVGIFRFAVSQQRSRHIFHDFAHYRVIDT